ncbi:MAG: very short patch repair endonuclease [Halomonas sp.]|uniref:very short patch repair endonuclease n=1 Tax=Halomonas sp. TaxID=1486246 RepID=UPI003F8EBB1C
MTDVLTEEQRSYCMSRINGKNTKPELALSKPLWGLGYRYKVRNRLPGKPDLVFPSSRTVIFVDGCFWHKCPDHFVEPKTRTQFWLDKINSNVARDRRNNESLRADGWQVFRIWEHEIKQSLANAIDRVVCVLEMKGSSLYF